ncbi:MAG: PH domain-containing protein, partial [Gemmatimonadota bacterium]|nr:PH domain-containing protein [Gemmatimonadota bacterium]
YRSACVPKAPGTPVIFRSPTWLWWLLGLAGLVSGVGTAVLFLREGVTAYSIGLALLDLLLAVGLTDALTTRVELNDEGLIRVANFRSRFVPRAQIESVSWEGGTGVAIRLTNGSWVRLPDVGNSQARANSIRGWIKRTAG